MAIPVQVGELCFGTKSEARIFFREMLNKYDVGDKVSAADEKILRDAVLQHPLSGEIVGCGILGFSVRTADYQTQCFWVNRTDNSTDKFSIYKCF